MLYEVITIIALILEHGAFTSEDTIITARVLRVYLIGLGFAAVDQMLVFASYRITSYNVCYTKLLRSSSSGARLSRSLWTGSTTDTAGRPASRASPPTSRPGYRCVITSYSIHYTKLYDQLLKSCGGVRGGLPHRTRSKPRIHPAFPR